MAIIQSGASATQWTIDTTSEAGRVTFYDTSGNPMSNVSSLGNILNALNDDVTIILGGQSTAGITVTGTTGSLTLSFEATIDSTNWFAINATPIPSGSPVTSTTANGQWVVDLAGFYAVRVRISSFTSGSMTVSVVVTPQNSKSIAQNVSIAGTLPVSGEVEIDGYVTTAAPTYTNNTAEPLSLTTSGALRVDGSAVTQPVSISGTIPISGTVTADQGAPNSIANSWPVEITDGYDILGTLINPIRIDPTGITTQPVSVETSPANIDSGNSSTTPLSGSATFTGTGLDVSGYAVIGVSAYSNRDGTLKLQFSSDNSNWDASIDYSALANNFIRVTTGPQARFFRVVYVNSGSAQAFFRLQTIEKPIANYPSTVPVDIVIDVDDDAIITKSIITGKTTGGGGGYVDVKVNPSGTLVVDASGSTVPVSGSVSVSGTVTANQGTAAALSGNWPVQVTDGTNTMPTGDTVGRAIFEKITDGANTASVTASSALKVDGSAVTQPVSGTVTSNIGTTNGLALDSSVNGLSLAQGSTTSGEKGVLTQGAVTTAAPTYTNAQTSPLSLTTAGSLRVDGSAVTQPVSGTVTSNQGTANSLANAWSAKITDTTNGPVAVKAASTAPVASDPSLVVTISPNSPPNATNTGVVSSNNSSTATLGIGAVFTGTSESSLSYESVAMSVMAIGASATPGTLSVQQSSDGTNWDIQDNFSVAGGTASPTGSFDIIVPLVASNFRIVYTNGAVAQTSFRLQTVKWPIKTSIPNATQKGTQPQVFTATQDAKDSGRVIKIFEATAAAVATTEGMITLTPLTDFVAGGTGTSFTVTAGKRLRIQSFVAAIRTTANTICGGLVKLRISSSGAVTTSTTLALSIGTGSTAAASGSAAGGNAAIPDGLELTGTMQLGVSAIGSLNTALWDISVIGYEY